MKVFAELTDFAATAGRAQLRHRVRELEEVGVDGISVSITCSRPVPDGRAGTASHPAATR
jgi:hypothetical protein